jgi:hypothetical protein
MKTRGPDSRRTATKPDHGVFDPDKFWGHVPSSPAASTETDSFDARVKTAWRFMRNVFFKPEEHTAAGEAMVRLVTHNPAVGLGHSDENDASPPTACG